MSDKIFDHSENNDGVPADILIVDDVYANVFLMENILNDRFRVKGIGSGNELWSYLKVSKPKLILLDLMMPFENGFEILEKLKKNDNYRKIQVIVVSAKDTKTDVVAAFKLGAADYIVKPIEEKALIAKVLKALHIDELPDLIL